MQGKKVGKIDQYTAPPYGKRVGLFSAVFKLLQHELFHSLTQCVGPKYSQS